MTPVEPGHARRASSLDSGGIDVLDREVRTAALAPEHPIDLSPRSLRQISLQPHSAVGEKLEPDLAARLHTKELQDVFSESDLASAGLR